MKKIFKITALLLSILLITGLMPALSANASSGAINTDYDSLDIDIGEDGCYLWADCFGDYSYINYYYPSEICDFDFVGWDGNSACFEIYPIAVGYGEITLNLMDDYDYLVDTCTIELNIKNGAYLETSADSIEIVNNGASQFNLTAVPHGNLPDLYYLQAAEFDNSIISISWGDWVNGTCEMTIYGLSQGISDILIYLRDSYTDEIMCSKWVSVIVENNFTFGTPIGDTDFDANITVSDARFCLRAAIGLEYVDEESPVYYQCDADEDGYITVADARLILRYAIGYYDVDPQQYADLLLEKINYEYDESDRYTTYDIDGNGVPELFLFKNDLYGNRRCSIYTLDLYGNIVYCGAFDGDYTLETKSGKLYANSYDNDFQSVIGLSLTSNMALDLDIIYEKSNPAKQVHYGTEVEVYEIDHIFFSYLI